ncbi:helix-turn-helix domain-containing protein [Modestobacter marinus]|uniref:Transcriptional regulator with XRE-family HTH domain n=1 Tax=Modestobacter marinus TaxID=477641 RepID=A0A846LR10_9ACTN|nr:helix-turn-helix domain-containing protein [Modestobacter marinus]NIH70283.1 transcriptional regulator with XRE-family HTH domain [Modestobacter marinus]
MTTSAAYLSQLRTGTRDNPSARHLAAIAGLFRVPIEYFFDEDLAARIDADMKLLVAVREAGVQTIALRAHGLSAAGLTGVADIIEHIRRLEQVNDFSPTDSPATDSAAPDRSPGQAVDEPSVPGEVPPDRA